MKTLTAEEMEKAKISQKKKEKNVKVCVVVSPMTDEAMEVRAFHERTTKSKIVQAALAEYLQKELKEIEEGKGR